MNTSEIRKAISLGLSFKEAAKVVLEEFDFYGGDLNTNNESEIDEKFMERLIRQLFTKLDPTLYFYIVPEWTYAGDKETYFYGPEDGEDDEDEDGEEYEPDQTAIWYRCDPKLLFDLQLPWYETSGGEVSVEAEEDCDSLNLLVSYFFGLDDEGHEKRMKLINAYHKKWLKGLPKKAKGHLNHPDYSPKEIPAEMNKLRKEVQALVGEKKPVRKKAV